jgi:hypothetical protein
VLRRNVWGLPSPLSFEVHDRTFFLREQLTVILNQAAALLGWPGLDHNQKQGIAKCRTALNIQAFTGRVFSSQEEPPALVRRSSAPSMNRAPA